MDTIIKKNQEYSQAALKTELKKRLPIDEELEQILAQQKAKIKVIGTGGAGNNTINRMSEIGITGTAPVVADIAKKIGALTVGIVTIPFSMEGQRRYENAIEGLEKLENIVDTLIVIPNDKLLELAPDLPLHTAFKVADEILTNAVKGIAELVTKAGLVNLDFADIKTVMGNGGIAMIGVGESD